MFICSGNRARSPLAEALFRRHAGPVSIEVASYGTLDAGSRKPLRSILEIAPSLGVDLSGHRSRPILDHALADADLVVGFEPHHLKKAVDLGGARPERTFMLLELPGLLKAVEGIDIPEEITVLDRARWIVTAMSRQRAAIPALPARSLADPFGEPSHVLAEVARIIDVVTASLAVELFPSTDDVRML